MTYLNQLEVTENWKVLYTSGFGVLTPQLGESHTPPGFKIAQATEILIEKATIKAVEADHTLPPSPFSLNSPFSGNVSQFGESIFWSMREVNWNEARQDAATWLFF